MAVKIISTLFLFLLSYLRHTFLINPNLTGEAFLIDISDVGQHSSQLSFLSMTCYFILFGLCNYLLAASFIRQKRNQWMLFYFILIIVAALFFGIYLITDFEIVFKVGSLIKNFLLSPVFPILSFIFFRLKN